MPRVGKLNQTETNSYFMPVFLIIVFFIANFHALKSNYFWFDEAGQYWISQGLNHYSSPLATSKGINSIIEMNREYSFDPGGFSLLLALWAKVSFSAWWLRLLPEFFSCVFIVFIVKILDTLRFSKFNQLLISILIITLSSTGSHLVELRPYSMEFALFSIALYLYLKNDSLPEDKLNFTIFWGLGILALLTRYGSTLWFFGILISIFLHHSKRWRFYLKKCLPGLIAYGISLSCIYFFSFRYQVGAGRNLDYLSYIKTDPGILLARGNLLFFFYATLSFSVAIWVVFLRNQEVIRKMLISAFAILILYFLSSALGLYPWDPYSKNMAPFSIFLVLLSATIFQFLSTQIPFRHISFFVIGTVICILFPIAKVAPFYAPWETKGVELVRFIQARDLNCGKDNRILIDDWMAPTIRLFFKFDSRADSDFWGYPENFEFMEGAQHTLVGRRIHELIDLKIINSREVNYCVIVGAKFRGVIDPAIYSYNSSIDVYVRKDALTD